MPEFPRQNEPADEGVYRLMCVHAEEEKAKTGNPRISSRWEIISRGEFEGKKVFHQWMLLPQSLWVIERDLEVIAGDRFFRDHKVSFDTPDLVGLESDAVVIIDDNGSGGKINKIDRFIRQGDMDTASEEVPF